MNIKLPIVKSPNVEDHDLNKLNFHYLIVNISSNFLYLMVFEKILLKKCKTSPLVKMCGPLFEQT